MMAEKKLRGKGILVSRKIKCDNSDLINILALELIVEVWINT